MFDQLDSSQNKAVPPANVKPFGPPPRPVAPAQPAKAEDIFSETDKGSKPEIFSPNPNSSEPPRGTVVPIESGWKRNKSVVIILLLGGLIVIAAGGYFGLRLALKSRQAANDTAVKEEPAKTDGKSENPEAKASPGADEAAEVEADLAEPAASVGQPLDSDSDGLTDEEEAAQGTDSNNPDTDGDGLTDREEISVYKTNPLIADTDGDGYLDGAEVANGYNPNGPGKLLEIK